MPEPIKEHPKNGTLIGVTRSGEVIRLLNSPQKPYTQKAEWDKGVVIKFKDIDRQFVTKHGLNADGSDGNPHYSVAYLDVGKEVHLMQPIMDEEELRIAVNGLLEKHQKDVSMRLESPEQFERLQKMGFEAHPKAYPFKPAGEEAAAAKNKKIPTAVLWRAAKGKISA